MAEVTVVVCSSVTGSQPFLRLLPARSHLSPYRRRRSNFGGMMIGGDGINDYRWYLLAPASVAGFNSGQVLQERGESTSCHGRATFSVLPYQD
ncbi:hypothetical protein M8C21_005873 [Ambrosia artemisiifolia]|uniref:Uncharacterized protein n=1 Tax=Ambrosia artemisiifolia TaxID=4212 RepID=A0AAD5C286_AMBAR|nr:hypothetical protein M8C21_005873 [Ambrosia artemisiifolia]